MVAPLKYFNRKYLKEYVPTYQGIVWNNYASLWIFSSLLNLRLMRGILLLRFSKTFAASAASVELVVSIGKEFLSRRERERVCVCVCGCERESNIISSKMLKQKWQSIQTEWKRERVFLWTLDFCSITCKLPRGYSLVYKIITSERERELLRVYKTFLRFHNVIYYCRYF